MQNNLGPLQQNQQQQKLKLPDLQTEFVTQIGDTEPTRDFVTQDWYVELGWPQDSLPKPHPICKPPSQTTQTWPPHRHSP